MSILLFKHVLTAKTAVHYHYYISFINFRLAMNHVQNEVGIRSMLELSQIVWTISPLSIILRRKCVYGNVLNHNAGHSRRYYHNRTNTAFILNDLTL